VNATYTWDVFCTLDGYGSFNEEGDWGGYWGKQGPEFLERRAAQYAQPQQMVLGANTFRMFQRFLAPLTAASEASDPINTRMKFLPTTVFSTTLHQPLDWPDACLIADDAVSTIARMKRETEKPYRSHGSLALNRALMEAGLVDQIQVTIFPVISGRTGRAPVFTSSADYDLDLLNSSTLDGNIQELVYRPRLH